MSAWVSIQLDTHAPVLTWGTASVSEGVLTVPYTVDEPGIVSARLVAIAGEWSLEVLQDRLATTLPSSATGAATVYALVRDDVGNEATYSLAVQLEGPPPAPEYGLGSGGGHILSHGGLPVDLGEEVEERHEAALRIQWSLLSDSIRGKVSASREISEVALAASVSAERQVSETFAGVRTPAKTWINALREDEEMVLVLGSQVLY